MKSWEESLFYGDGMSLEKKVKIEYDDDGFMWISKLIVTLYYDVFSHLSHHPKMSM